MHTAQVYQHAHNRTSTHIIATFTIITTTIVVCVCVCVCVHQ